MLMTRDPTLSPVRSSITFLADHPVHVCPNVLTTNRKPNMKRSIKGKYQSKPAEVHTEPKVVTKNFLLAQLSSYLTAIFLPSQLG